MAERRKPPGIGGRLSDRSMADGNDLTDTPDIPEKQARAMEVLIAQGRLDRQLELVREHWASVRHLWLDTPEPLRIARLDGLPPDFWFGAGMPGLAKVRDRGHRFEFAETGMPALIIPCYDCTPGMIDANPERHVEELRDLVAVDLDHPDRFWRRRGEALVLGNAFLEIAGQEFEPVPVYRNPMTWLRAGGAGIAILDWDYARDLLLDHEIVAENLKLGDRLAAVLKPDIWIMAEAA